MRYEHDHFITEGKVLYLLDDKDVVVGRTLYKIKPRDIEEVHWGTFDEIMKARIEDAMKKMNVREIQPSWENLRSEMDMREKEWSKFSKQVEEYMLSLNPTDSGWQKLLMNVKAISKH